MKCCYYGETMAGNDYDGWVDVIVFVKLKL